MEKLLKNLLYNLLGIKTKSEINSNINNRTFVTASEVIQFNAKEKMKAIEATRKAGISFKKLIKNPKKLVKFIESKGTKVIIAKNIEKVLTFLGVDEGFVPEQKGFSALVLSIFINLLSRDKVKVSLQTPAMFIIRSLKFDIYCFAHQYHHWVSYKTGLSGYDCATQDNFKNIWKTNFDQKDIDNLKVQDILSLKDAIKRDLDAIDFVKTMSREIVGANNSIKKLKNGEAVSL